MVLLSQLAGACLRYGVLHHGNEHAPLASSRNHMLREVEIMKDINYRQQRHYEISQEYRDVINMKMHDLKKFFLSNTSVVQKTRCSS